MKKKTNKSGIPSLREAFVVREKYGCDGDHDDDDKDVKEAGPPPIPGTTPGKPPPPPSQAMSKPVRVVGRDEQALGNFVLGAKNDVVSAMKEFQVNKKNYPGLEISSELQSLKTAVDQLSVKFEDWRQGQTSQAMFGGNA